MTTSDGDPTKQALAGLPDPELVATWANEFFKAGIAGVGSPAGEDVAAVAPAAPPSSVLAPATPRTAPAAAATSAGMPAAPTLQSAASAAPGGAPSASTLGGGPPISEFWSAFVAVPTLNSAAPYGGALDAAIAATAPVSAFEGLPGADLWSGFAGVPASSAISAAPAPGSLDAPLSAQPSTPSFYFLDATPPATTAPAVTTPAAPVPATPGLATPGLATPDLATPDLSAFGQPAIEQPAAKQPAIEQPAAKQPVIEQPAAKQPAQPPLDLGLRGRQFDAATIRRDFPILEERVNGRRLTWLDNAATTQKPQVVIDRISYFYEHENSNVHRGAHTLAARSSDAYEAAREKIRGFLNAPSAQDIVFVRGATEGINLVAQAWGRRNVHAGDEIIISWLEHHSNIVPWQMLASETGARVRVAPIDDSGQIRLDEYEKLFNPRTRFVSVTQVSNALGTVTPIKQMIEVAHRYGVPVLVDGAQAVSHFRTDVQALDADFYVFSGHKVFGPTGIGALYGKSELLSAMPPWQGGGNMIADVTFDKTVYNPPPSRFEAGTGNIADAVGLGAAIAYVENVGLENIARYEHDLLAYLKQRLLEVPRLHLIGTAQEQAGVQSFVIDGLSNEQIGGALAREGIAVRAGHHCAQPALRRFGCEGTVRPSLALYNTREDVDALIAVLLQLQSGW